MAKLIKELDDKATSVENYMKELITDTEFLNFLAEEFIEEFWDTNYNYGQEVVRDYIADTAVGANTFFIPVENLEDYIVEDTDETDETVGE